MESIEITAPVGSYESLQAAIQSKADSVYFGAGHLNMRSRSSANFNLEDISEIVSTCKGHGIKTYMTLNTVVYDHEIVDMQLLIDHAVAVRVDAIIASDMAVFRYAGNKGIPVHASTQCNITNIEAVKFFSQFADVMVLARELDLEKVFKITQLIREKNICGPSGNLVKIEVFIHGALCMAVSGKCYLSLDNLNSSANRGACLQVCRRPYQVKDLDGGIELAIDNKYIMSPKDLCTLPFLDKILNAGVGILKIEGRGRSPEYVKTVVNTYKAAIKDIQNGTFNKESIDRHMVELSKVYNRGFWDGYYLGRSTGEWTERYGSQATEKKEYVGKITNYFSQIKVAEITMETGAVSVGDEIYIIGPSTGIIRQQIKEIRTDLKNTNTTQKGNISSIPVSNTVRRNDKVYKIITIKELF